MLQLVGEDAVYKVHCSCMRMCVSVVSVVEACKMLCTIYCIAFCIKSNAYDRACYSHMYYNTIEW